MEPKLIAAALVVAGFWIGAPAQVEAGILWYRSRADWIAAAGPASFREDFADFAVDTSFRTSTLALEGMRIRQEGVDPGTVNFVDVPPLSAGHAFIESEYAFVGVVTASDGEPMTTVRIRFDDTNVAFGGDSWGAATGAGALLEVYDGVALLGVQSLLGGSTQDGPNFLGYVLTEGDIATTVRFVAGSDDPDFTSEGFALDDLAGVAVPEPAGLPLLCLGVSGLAFCCRSRMR